MNPFRKHRQRLLLAATAIVMSAQFAAATDPPAGILACAEEADDGRRLACYDRAVARAKANSPGEAETPVHAPSAGARVREEATAERFGMTPELAHRVENKDPESPAKPDHIQAVVVRIDERPRGERVVFLDIGQVWEEKSPNRHLQLDVGDPVTVRSGAFGSFRLTVGNSNRFTRVERIR